MRGITDMAVRLRLIRILRGLSALLAAAVLLTADTASARLFKVNVKEPDYGGATMTQFTRTGERPVVSFEDLIRNSEYEYKIVAAFHSG